MTLQYIISYLPGPIRPWAERLSRSPIARRLAGGALWSMVGAVILRLAALVTSFVVARLVGAEGFGEYGTAQGTIGMLGVFAGLGLGLTSTKFVSEFLPTDKARVGRIIALCSILSWGCGLLVGSFLFVAAQALAVRVLNSAGISILLWAAIPFLICSTVNGAQLGVLSGFQAFRAIAWVNVTSGICALSCTVVGAKMQGTLGAVSGLSLSQILTTALYMLAVRRESQRYGVTLGYRRCWGEWAMLWRFSAPALLSNLVFTPAFWLCNSIMVNQMGGYAEAGIYNAANQWRVAILFLPTAFGSVTLPMMAGLHGVRDRKGYYRVLWAGVGLSVGAAAVVALPIVLCGSLIMQGYGAGFTTGAIVLRLLACASIIMAGLNVVGQTIACDGRMWIGALLNLLWAAALVGCYYPLRHTGATGLGIANLIAYLFHLITSLMYVYLSRQNIEKPVASGIL